MDFLGFCTTITNDHQGWKSILSQISWSEICSQGVSGATLLPEALEDNLPSSFQLWGEVGTLQAIPWLEALPLSSQGLLLGVCVSEILLFLLIKMTVTGRRGHQKSRMFSS